MNDSTDTGTGLTRLKMRRWLITLVWIIGIAPFGMTQNFSFDDQELEVGEVLITYQILFDFAKATIRPESESFLNDLKNFLTDHPEVSVEVSNHCDERISKYSSTCLTCKRAEAVASWLKEQGIEPDRVKHKGYNDLQPLIKGATTEEEHQKNRRTEIKIISTQAK